MDQEKIKKLELNLRYNSGIFNSKNEQLLAKCVNELVGKTNELVHYNNEIIEKYNKLRNDFDELKNLNK